MSIFSGACFARQIKDTTNSSQNYKKHRFSVGGSFGYGIPTEAYGTSTTGTQYGFDRGYANPGIHFDVNFNFQICKHLGVLLEGEGNDNPYNPSYSKLGGYYFGAYMAGPFYSVNFRDGDIFEIRLDAGFVTLRTTQAFIYFIGFSPTVNYGFGGALGVKFKKHRIKGIFITAEISYTKAQVRYYDDVSEKSYESGPIGITTGAVGVEFKF